MCPLLCPIFILLKFTSVLHLSEHLLRQKYRKEPFGNKRIPTISDSCHFHVSYMYCSGLIRAKWVHGSTLMSKITTDLRP